MIIVTMLSLGVAAVSGVMAWRVLRADRLRSAARVLSLESAIDGEEIVYRTVDDDAVQDFEWETPETPALALAPQAPSNRLFADNSVEHPSSRHRTLLTAVACLVAGVVVIVLMAMFADRSDRSTSAADVPAKQTLELMAMTHTRQSGALIVSGLVHNASPTETAPLTTIVTALDREGQVVARGSASLSALAPGKTLPFSVRIDYPGPLGRYRVSFRSSAGVLPHIDRRGPPANPTAVAE
jgi:hypothetical protein